MVYPFDGRQLNTKNTWLQEPSRIYYVSTTDGDDSRSIEAACNPKTPWKTLEKISTLKLKPGESVLLKRGDIFYDSLVISAAGTQHQPIIIGAYGDGADPVISGSVKITKWNQQNEGIWSTSLPFIPGNVLKDGYPQSISRYPKDYLTIDSVLSPKSFRFKGIIPYSCIGATVGIQFVSWAMSFQPIISIDSNVITLASAPKLTNNLIGMVTGITAGKRFFLTNHVSLLLNNGNWVYDSEKKQLLFKSEHHPENIEASQNQFGIYINASKYIIVRDIAVEKTAQMGIEIVGKSSSISLQNIKTEYTGDTGIKVTDGDSISILHCSVSSSGITGIGIHANNSTINNCTVSNIGVSPETIYQISLIERMGYGLISYGENNNISANIVDSTGYNGITFYGIKNRIDSNEITNYCMLLEDGGGIYTSGADSVDGSLIYKNFIKQTIFHDSGKEIEGIYLDSMSKNCKVEDNTIIGARFGIYLDNAYNHTIINNKVFNPLLFGIYINENPKYNHLIKDNVITGNEITTISPNTYCFSINQKSLSNNIGVIDSNTYRSLYSDIYFLFYNNSTKKQFLYSINRWKNNNYDINSSFVQDIIKQDAISDRNLISSVYKNTDTNGWKVKTGKAGLSWKAGDVNNKNKFLFHGDINSSIATNIFNVTRGKNYLLRFNINVKDTSCISISLQKYNENYHPLGFSEMVWHSSDSLYFIFSPTESSESACIVFTIKDTTSTTEISNISCFEYKIPETSTIEKSLIYNKP